MTNQTEWAAVEAAAAAAERGSGVVGVAVRWHGEIVVERRGDRAFRSASTIKVPIMVELFRQVDAGTLRLDDRYALRDADRVPGSGVLQHLHAGLELTLDDLCTLMIAISDNTATNVLLDRVGMERARTTMSDLGMYRSVLGRQMLGRLPAEHEGENWTTPRDLATVMVAIVAGAAASPVGCARMVAMLERQDSARRITRHAPPGSRWGSKPGSLPGNVHDVGFVATDAGTLVVAVMTEGLPGEAEAETAIAEIARQAMRAARIRGN